MSIYKKRKIAIQNGKKMGQIDERFMKKAEDMLFGEFSVSLGMPRDEVEVYIKKRVRNLT
jgi:CarD family transcriptional regulator